MNEIISMSSVEAYNMFMDGLDPQLHQLNGTVVTSRGLDEAIEVVKMAMVYGEDKKKIPQSKTQNKQKGRQSNGQEAKGGRGSWGPSKGNGPTGQVRIVVREPTSEVTPGTMMAVTNGGTAEKKKAEKS